MATAKKKGEGDWLSWGLIAVLFLFGLWPIGLILLLVKLFGGDGKKKALPDGIEEVQPGRAKAAARRMTRTPLPKKSNAKWLKIVGGILMAVGVIACVDPIDMMIWLGEIESYYVEDLLTALAIAAGGGAMVCSGVSMDHSLKRYGKYLAVLGDREAMPVGDLARTLGYSERRTERDLQKMIDKGYFGGKAYLNVELGYLFRSGEADAQFRRQQAAAKTPEEAEKGYSGILRSIRRANDLIADPILSAKIDRLESITARIFQAVEADPKKRSRIDTFLNYYLPTTQKLLDSYAEFEAAGVEGENLRQAKQRIETTMDTIVRGFEHQLDELYQSDALDVDSDIRVMESMLRWNTATVEEDFGPMDGGETPAEPAAPAEGALTEPAPAEKQDLQ